MTIETIIRRLRAKTGGLGYWSAVDAVKPYTPNQVLHPESLNRAQRMSSEDVIKDAWHLRRVAAEREASNAE